jgi:ubiquinone/menaquinone biosynthesis C-methylase UbiE
MKESNDWNAEQYNKDANFVSSMAMPLVEVLSPKEHERILDLGCGDGTLAKEIQKITKNLVAVDLNADMVEKTKKKNIEAYIMSATNLNFEQEFDAVFSNAVLHWVKDQDLALQNINRVLKKGGRFVCEFGGYQNINSIVSVMESVFENTKEYGKFTNPWYFPTKEEYHKCLVNNGFKVISIELYKRETPINDIKNWLDVFANGILENLNEHQQAQCKKEIRDILKEKILTKDNVWVVDYVRLKVVAIKK